MNEKRVLGFLEIVVIECISSESNEKRFTVHTDFCFADCVKRFDNVTPVLTNACQQSTKKRNRQEACSAGW